MERFDIIIGPVARALTLGGYYGDMPYHFRIWSGVVERLAGTAWGEPTNTWIEVWNGLRQYPAVIGLYSLGVGTLAARRPEALAPCLAALNPGGSADTSVRPDAIQGAVAYLVSQQSRPTAVSSWLENRLVGFSEGAIQLELLEVAFDQFEYLLGLVDADHSLGPELNGGVYPRPRLFWFRQRRAAPGATWDTWAAGVRAQAWLDVGMFDGSADRLGIVKNKYDEAITQRRMFAHLGF